MADTAETQQPAETPQTPPTKAADASPTDASPADKEAAAVTAEAKDDKRLGKAWATVQRREQQVARERKAFEDERRKHASELERVRKLEEATKLYEQDPVAWLEKHGGVDAYKRLTGRMLNDGKVPVDEEVAALRKQLADITAENQRTREEAKLASQQASAAAWGSKVEAAFTDEDRAIASVWNIDLQKEILEFGDKAVIALREAGLTDEEIRVELTHDKVAGTIRNELKERVSGLKDNPVLKKLFGAAAESAKPSAPSKPTGASINNAMAPAATERDHSDLTLPQRLALAKKRLRVS